MDIRFYTKAESFLGAYRDFLEKEEVVNSLLLGLAARATREDLAGEGFLLFGGHKAQLPVCCGLRSPGRALVPYCPGLKQKDYRQLAKAVRERDPDIPGITGEKESALSLATAWSEISGLDFRVEMRQLVYRLDKVHALPVADGTFRKASLLDLDVLADWTYHFYRETGLPACTPEEALLTTHRRIKAGEFYVWEADQPVSMAARARPTRHGITVNAVYTPPEFRGKGFALHCVASLSRSLLAEGYAFCTLFTDMDFPTSNRLYRRIGYLPVSEFRSVKFV